MSLADIKKKIEADAGAEARKILDRAKEQAAQIAAEADREIKEIRSSYEERFKAEEPEILRRREIVANLDVKKISLGARQQLIDEVYRGALEKLSSLPSEKYLSFMENMLNGSVKEGDELVVTVGKDERYITQDWLKGYNERHRTNLSLSDVKAPISGGFVLSRDNVSENASFEMLVRWLRDDLEADVVKRLFSE